MRFSTFYTAHKRLCWVVFILISPLVAFQCIDWIEPADLAAKKGSRIVLAQDGTVLRTFADDNGIWRHPVIIDDVSPRYLTALIQYEDRFFYSHPGVNPLALARAFGQAIRYGEIVSGGSTLTMQVARMRYPEPRNLWGKAKEILRALQLERHYSKQEILTYYLNHAPFGGTIEGVQAAALSYFGYDAKYLTHAQAALLAVLPQAPTRYRPDRNPKAAQQARDKVIDRLTKQGIWPADIATDAKQETVQANGINRYQTAPLLARRLVNQSDQRIIRTTLNGAWQQNIEARVTEYVQGIGQQVSAAVLIMENATGEVKTYVGSGDFSDAQRSGHVDMVTAIRSPGSTLKPFIYAQAIDQGYLHSESLLLNVPLKFADYQPENFTGGFSGPVSTAEALVASLNVPAVQVLEYLEPVAFYLDLQKAGAQLQLPENARPSLAIALGGLGTNLESLVTLFSALDHQGQTVKPKFIQGQAKLTKPLLSAGSAWITRQMLASAANAPMGLAIKTGTSYGYRDNWAIAVADGYTLGVWVGKPDGTPLTGHFGRQTAVPLLSQVAAMIVHHNAMPAKPDSVSKHTICWPTGREETEPLCDEARTAWLLNSAQPRTWMNIASAKQAFTQAKTTLKLANDSGQQVPFGCSLDYTENEVALWPAPLQLWLPETLRSQTKLPTFDSRCDRQLTTNAAVPVKIGGLREGDAFIASEQESVALFAQGGQAPYIWYVNGQRMENDSAKLTLSISGEATFDVVLMDFHGQLDRQQVTSYF